MKKLWGKGYQLDKEFEHFTVGEDVQYDTRLILSDCLGGIVHAAMLKKIGIQTVDEFKQLHSGNEMQNFKQWILPEQENWEDTVSQLNSIKELIK